MKTRFAFVVLTLILVGCSRGKVPAPGEIDYLWTVPSPQGEAILGPQSRPTPDQLLNLRIATDSQPATVLVATFQDRVLSVSSPPVLIKVPAKSEDKIEWKLPEARESSKVFAAFLPADGESSREMEALLQRFSEQKEGNGPAAQRLYDRLSEWAGEDRTGSASEGEQIVELGAAMSTSLMSPEASRPRVGDDVSPQGANMESQNPAAAFDWRKNSRQAAFGADVHPVVIYDFVSAGR